MTERDEYKFVSPDIEGGNNAVIAHAESKLRTPLQANVRKFVQPSAQFPDVCQNPSLCLRRKTKEDTIKLAGIDLRCLAHEASGLLHPHLAITQVGLAALDARDELRI
jgi:hypothetical protein